MSMWLIVIQLIASIIAGFVMGPRYRVYWLFLASPAIALVSATATWLSGSGFLACSATAFACVTAMQVAFMVATWVHVGSEPSSPEPCHNRAGNHGVDIDYDLQLLSLQKGRAVGSKAVAALPSAEASQLFNS